MIFFVLWISVGGHWFVGQDYRDPGSCEAEAVKIRAATKGVTVICGPRGMP